MKMIIGIIMFTSSAGLILRYIKRSLTGLGNGEELSEVYKLHQLLLFAPAFYFCRKINVIMKKPSALSYVRDIIIFPFTITIIIPYSLYNPQQAFIPATIIFKIAGIIFFIVGLYLFLATNYLFITVAKATLAPWSPKQNLVVQGPYRYCRNPMITGVLFILFSEAFYFHSTNILLWSCFVIVANTIFFIKVEEPYLTKTFGEQYNTYKANVPRWLPRFTPYK